jgi:hypothetical protein
MLIFIIFLYEKKYPRSQSQPGVLKQSRNAQKRLYILSIFIFSQKQRQTLLQRA